MSEVIIVRTRSGEVVIGQCVDIASSGSVTLKKPYQMVPAGQGQIGMTEWMPYAKFDKDLVVIPSEEVLYVLDPVPQLLQGYQQQTSNIVVPSNLPAVTPEEMMQGDNLRLTSED